MLGQHLLVMSSTIDLLHCVVKQSSYSNVLHFRFPNAAMHLVQGTQTMTVTQPMNLSEKVIY